MKLLASLIPLFAWASVATAQDVTIARAGSQAPQPGPSKTSPVLCALSASSPPPSPHARAAAW